MPAKTNRRQLILDVAVRLFMENGYSATTTREIAEEVGLTEAALYYHFRDGKRALLQAALGDSMPDLMKALEASRAAHSLPEFIVRYGHEIAKVRHTRAKYYRWIAAEIPRLNPDEQAFLQQHQIRFHAELVTELRRFIADEDKATAVAWTIMCVVVGYFNLFVSLDLESVTDGTPSVIANLLAETVGELA